MRRVARRRNRCRNKALSRRRAPRLPIRKPSRSATSWRDPTACSARPQESTRKFARQRLRPAICRSFLHPAALAAIRRSGRNKSRSAVGGPQTAAPRKYGDSQSALAAVLRDVDFRGLPAFHDLCGTVWFWICDIRFRMEQLSRAKLLVCHCCRFYRNPSGGFRLRDLDRCSLVDFRKPRSIPLKAVGPLNRGVRRAFHPDPLRSTTFVTATRSVVNFS
jgi:hypothetical protein